MTVVVRALDERDLPEADRIFRLAFGTFIGLPEPSAFAGDADYVRTRWRTDPSAAFGAYGDDGLVGSSFAARWGSFGFFGPLTVRPDLWNAGVGKRLLDAAIARFDDWGVRLAALFTFAQSTKHVGLYQRYGFWPQQLTVVMSKPVDPRAVGGACSFYSGIPAGDRPVWLARVAEIAGSVFPGLDPAIEIDSIDAQGIGETLLLSDEQGAAGLAVCHVGARSEAGSGTAYVKFGVVRPGAGAGARFAWLLAACEALAAARGARALVAGVNTARRQAYRAMMAHGFRAVIQGVGMQRPDETGFNRPDCFVMDDWR